MTEELDWHRAAQKALEDALERLGFASDSLERQTARLPVFPRAHRRFMLPGAFEMFVNPGSSWGWQMRQIGGPRSVPTEELVEALWRNPRLVLRAVRQIEAATAWVERVAAACRREWAARLQDPSVRSVAEQVVGVAALSAIRQDDEGKGHP